MASSQSATVDVGLPRPLPVGSVYVGDRDDHIVWRVDFDEEGAPIYRCERCGGLFTRHSDEACVRPPGWEPYRSESDA